MKYISHLDLLRLFQRASRRAGIPLLLTEGFNPHPKIKIEPALKLGAEAVGLKATVKLRSPLSAEYLRERLSKELPSGIEITEIRQINPSTQSRLNPLTSLGANGETGRTKRRDISSG